MLLSQVYQHRHLLKSFVWRDLRTRYAGARIGVLWSIIHPLILLGLYVLVFSTIVRTAGISVHGKMSGYALFLCPAIFSWSWLNESLVNACHSITGNTQVIKRIAFPSAILPVAPSIAALAPFLVTMAALILVVLFTPHASAALLFLPVIVVLQFLLMLGPAYLLASLNVFVRDTSHVVIAIFQVMFWATPIVYPPETLTTPFPFMDYWFRINPAAHLMAAYRDVIIGQRFPALQSMLYLTFITIITYHAGRTVFLRSMRHFADEA